MAQLFRYLFTDDRQRSEVFTFMLPSNYILGPDIELKSRDFTATQQKWSLLFTKTNNDSINAYLTLKSVHEGMTVTADYGITLINREHFTLNESFVEKNAKFGAESASQGRKGFVTIESLCTKEFMDERGNIQCELEVKNVSTAFSYDVQISPQPSYNRAASAPNEAKFLSGTFSFGNYDWNICIQTKMDGMGAITGMKFYLYRLTSLDHLCRISYRYKFINGAFVLDSGLIDQYSDINGASNSYRTDKVKELLQLTGKFVIRLELVKVNSVFPIILYPFADMPQAVQFYDRDRQAWMMDSCIEDNCFILRLFYTDINNIPSGYVRVLSFNISIRHHEKGPIYVFKKPVIKYYYKRESDDGLEIATTIDINEVTSSGTSGYLDQDGGITIEIEWSYSHLLHQPEYSHLDDIIRKQKLQMTREIQTLQQENYSLEKQLHMAQAANQNPSNPNQPRGGGKGGFENQSASSTASSGVGSSISTGSSNQPGGPGTPSVVKKYMEQRYGPGGSPLPAAGGPADKNNLNNKQNNQYANAPPPAAGGLGSGGGLFNQSFTQNLLGGAAGNGAAGGGLSSLTSQFTTGFANLKIVGVKFSKIK